jgi:hypothetical protein
LGAGTLEPLQFASIGLRAAAASCPTEAGGIAARLRLLALRTLPLEQSKCDQMSLRGGEPLADNLGVRANSVWDTRSGLNEAVGLAQQQLDFG